MRCAVALRSLAAVAGLLVAGCAAGPVAASPSPTASPPAAPTGLPGERLDLYPYAGAVLAVVGVAADDTLSVRSGPGTGFEVLAELAPLADGIPATGHNRSLPDRSWWTEVQAGAGTGWVNSRFVAQLGGTEDVTSTLPQPIRAGSLPELATAVIAARHLESDAGGNITVVDGPRAGDLDELVVDVLGLADDSQRGERLHIFAVRAADGYTVRTVEAAALCARGVTPEGLCT